MFCVGKPTCEVCGRKTYGKYRRVCNTLWNVPCVHLGDETDVILIRCQTCRGRVRQKFPVHECEVHGRCLPTYRGEKQEIRQCSGCEDYAQ